MDTNEFFLDNTVSCTFIDPRPELLLSLIKEGDFLQIKVIGEKIQDVDMSVFSELGEGDVLFIDSTHVAKALSDVNHIFFEILPRLRRGVLIHIHDIFYPFVYPRDWELEGRGWNEAYVLRAFLQFNSSFRIYFCNTFLEYFHDTQFKKEMPLCMKNTGGSIWLEKFQ
ncbi:MAG: class I SAM-dependent methyltransferase [Acidobacteria bacterium]|nr:class I SAM-dependent methyltransferase [Acidobacteriota bacterium]